MDRGSGEFMAAVSQTARSLPCTRLWPPAPLFSLTDMETQPGLLFSFPLEDKKRPWPFNLSLQAIEMKTALEEIPERSMQTRQ
ncbi:hypothetical protein ACOMHN_035387 [Nucella lapillus]